MSFSSLWAYGRTLALGAALAALPVLAQDADQASNTDQFSQQGSQYNRAAETTIQGTVAAVNTNTPTGVHVILDTDQGRFDVQLGPQAFLQDQQIMVQPGQRIQVTGSQSTGFGGQQELIARQVTMDGNTATLRTASGVPLWSGNRQYQAGQQGPYTAPEQQYGQSQFPYQTGPYTNQQGQYGPYAGQPGQQQPPMQSTPYAGQPGPFSQSQPTQAGISNWQHGSIYNPFTETSITGTVQQVRQCACGPFSSTYATLNTSQGKVTVQLAPQQFLSQNQLQLTRGQQIQVTGSQLNVNGNQVLLARVVSTPQRTVALRNAQGTPQWQAGQAQPGFAGGMPSTDDIGESDGNF